MVILPQPIICPTMGLGLPTLPEWVSPQLSQGQQEGTEVVSRQRASDPQFCLPEPQFFLFSCGDNHIQVIRNRGLTVHVLLDSQFPWSIKWLPLPPTPCPLPSMKDASCKLFPSLTPLSFCSSSEWPRWSSVLCLGAYLIWCFSKSDPGITCIRIPWGQFLGGSWLVTTLGTTQTFVTRIPTDEAKDRVLKCVYKWLRGTVLWNPLLELISGCSHL